MKCRIYVSLILFALMVMLLPNKVIYATEEPTVPPDITININHHTEIYGKEFTNDKKTLSWNADNGCYNTVVVSYISNDEYKIFDGLYMDAEYTEEYTGQDLTDQQTLHVKWHYEYPVVYVDKSFNGTNSDLDDTTNNGTFKSDVQGILNVEVYESGSSINIADKYKDKLFTITESTWKEDNTDFHAVTTYVNDKDGNFLSETKLSGESIEISCPVIIHVYDAYEVVQCDLTGKVVNTIDIPILADTRVTKGRKVFDQFFNNDIVEHSLGFEISGYSKGNTIIDNVLKSSETKQNFTVFNFTNQYGNSSSNGNRDIDFLRFDSMDDYHGLHIDSSYDMVLNASMVAGFELDKARKALEDANNISGNTDEKAEAIENATNDLKVAEAYCKGWLTPVYVLQVNDFFSELVGYQDDDDGVYGRVVDDLHNTTQIVYLEKNKGGAGSCTFTTSLYSDELFDSVEKSSFYDEEHFNCITVGDEIPIDSEIDLSNTIICGTDEIDKLYIRNNILFKLIDYDTNEVLVTEECPYGTSIANWKPNVDTSKYKVFIGTDTKGMPNCGSYSEYDTTENRRKIHYYLDGLAYPDSSAKYRSDMVIYAKAMPNIVIDYNGGRITGTEYRQTEVTWKLQNIGSQDTDVKKSVSGDKTILSLPDIEVLDVIREKYPVSVFDSVYSLIGVGETSGYSVSKDGVKNNDLHLLVQPTAVPNWMVQGDYELSKIKDNAVLDNIIAKQQYGIFAQELYNSDNYTPTKNGPDGTPLEFKGFFTEFIGGRDIRTFTLEELTAIDDSDGPFMVYARYSDYTGVDEITISYQTNCDEKVNSTLIERSTTLSEVPELSRDDASFGGWYLDKEFKNEWSKDYVFNDHATLYAKWDTTHTVNFILDGVVKKTIVVNHKDRVDSEFPELESDEIDSIDDITESDWYKVHYKRDGWFFDEDFSGLKYTNNQIVSDTNLYLKRINVGVIAYYHRDSYYGVQAISKGSKVEPLSAPTDIKDNERFLGWYTGKQCSDSEQIFEGINSFSGNSFSVHSNLDTITVDTKKVVIHFETNINGLDIPDKVVEGDSWQFSGYRDTEYEGYIFKGWYHDPEFMHQVEAYYEFDAGEYTLYAKWVEESDSVPETVRVKFVTFDDNVKVDDIVIPYDTALPNVPKPTRNGYKFKHWYYIITPNGMTSTFYSYQHVKEDMILYAVWEEDDIEVNEDVTISFVTNIDGVTVNDMVVPKGSSITFPTLDKPHHTLSYWYILNGDTELEVDSNYKFTEDTTVYAKWEPTTGIDPVMITVSFVSDRGPQFNPTIIEKGGTLDEIYLNINNETDYNFDGWYLNNNYTGNKVDKNTVFEEDTVLYAKWVKKGESEHPKRIWITFVSEEGPAYMDEILDYGSTLPEMYFNHTSIKPNRVFDGWYLNPEFKGDKITRETTFTTNTTLYAKFVDGSSSKKITISFDTGVSNANVPSVQIAVNSTVTLPYIETGGKKVDHWYFNDGGNKIVVDSSYKFKKDTTLIAVWKNVGDSNKEDVTIYFESSYGNCPDNITISSGSTIDSKYFDMSANGYEFIGWFRIVNGDKKFVDYDTKYTEDTYLIAEWKKIDTVIVSFETGVSGLSVDSQVVVKGTSIVSPNVDRPGFSIEGWYYNPDYTGDKWKLSDVFESNVTLYAKWKEIKSSVEVYFVTNAYQVYVPKQVVSSGNTIDIPEVSRDDYTLDGWYYDYDFIKKYKVEDTFDEDTVLYAKWNYVGSDVKSKHTVTIYSGLEDNLVYSYQVDDGTIIHETDNEWLKDSGYDYGSFKSCIYKDMDDWSTIDLQKGVTVNRDYRIFMQWYADVNVVYRDQNGNTVVEDTISMEVNPDSPFIFEIDKDDPEEEINGKLYKAIDIETDITGESFKGTYLRLDKIKYAGTVFINIEEIRETVKVTVKNPHGKDVVIEVTKGNKPELSNPSHGESEFTGYYLDEDCTVPYDSSPLNENKVLYVGWLETVHFIDGNETYKDPVKVKYGSTVDLVSVDDKEDSKFVGWSTSNTEYKPWNFKYPVTDTLHLYTHYVSNDSVQNRVIYVWNFKPEQEVYVPYGYYAENMTEDDMPGRFMGWYTDATYKTKFNFDTPITEDTKIYAGIEMEVTYVLKYDDKVEHGYAWYGNKADDMYFDREDYDFEGWYTDNKLKKKFDFKQPVYEDLILYAKWSKVKNNSSGGNNSGGSSQGSQVIASIPESNPTGTTTINKVVTPSVTGTPTIVTTDREVWMDMNVKNNGQVTSTSKKNIDSAVMKLLPQTDIDYLLNTAEKNGLVQVYNSREYVDSSAIDLVFEDDSPEAIRFKTNYVGVKVVAVWLVCSVVIMAIFMVCCFLRRKK